MTQPEKRCARCRETKSAEHFYVKAAGRLASPCKVCHAEAAATRYVAQRESQKARAAAYYAANREKIRAKQAAYYAAASSERVPMPGRGGRGVAKTPLQSRPEVTCKTCGALFRRSGNNALAPRFCSRSCQAVGQKKPGGPGIDATCDGCGAAFRRGAAALARQKRSFCTEACMRMHRPRARRDRTKAWRGIQWRQISDLIRCLDNYTCQWCGQPETGTEELSVDHIIPFHSFDDVEQANSYDNLVALHRDCHNRKTTGPERKWKMGNTKELEEWMRRVKANRDSTRFGIQRPGAA